MGAAIPLLTGADASRTPSPDARPPVRHEGGDLTAEHWKVIGFCWALVAAAAGGELAGVLPEAVAPLIGLVIAAVFGLSFLHRFWPTLLALLVLRPALDVFKNPDAGGFDVTLLVGFIFLGGASVWLMARAAAGTLRPPSTPTLTFAAFCVAAGVSSMGAAVPVVAAQSAVKLVSAALMLAVLEQILGDDPERLRPIVIAAIWSLAIPALGGLLQYFEGPEKGDWVGLGRIRSTFVHPNAFATFLMFIGLFSLAVRSAFTGRLRVAATAAALVTLPLLYFTLARSAWAGLIVGTIVIMWKLHRRMLWLVPLGLVLLLALPTTRARLADLTKEDDVTQRGNANSLSWRLEYWGDVAPMFRDSPVIGIGPDMVRETHPDHFEPHNTLLQSVVEFGLLGCAIFVGFFLAAIAALRRAWSLATTPLVRGVALGGLAMVAGYLTQAPVENVMFQVVLWWYLVIPIAAASAVVAAATATKDPVATDTVATDPA